MIDAILPAAEAHGIARRSAGVYGHVVTGALHVTGLSHEPCPVHATAHETIAVHPMVLAHESSPEHVVEPTRVPAVVIVDLHDRFPSHPTVQLSVAVHVIALLQASLPSHATAQVFPEHSMGLSQPLVSQVMRQLSAVHLMGDLHESPRVQSTEQAEPPQVMALAQARSSVQRTSQRLALEQSMAPAHESRLPQSTAHGTPAGHVTPVAQSPLVLSQRKVQTPSTHSPGFAPPHTASQAMEASAPAPPPSRPASAPSGPSSSLAGPPVVGAVVAPPSLEVAPWSAGPSPVSDTPHPTATAASSASTLGCRAPMITR